MTTIKKQVKNPILLKQCEEAIEQITGMKGGIAGKRSLWHPRGGGENKQEYSAKVAANYYLQKEADQKTSLDAIHETGGNNLRLKQLLVAPVGQEVVIQGTGGEEVFYKNGTDGTCVTLASTTNRLAINTSTGGCVIKMKATGSSMTPKALEKNPTKLSADERRAHPRAIYLYS